MYTFYRAAAAIWKRLLWAFILLPLLLSCWIGNMPPPLLPKTSSEAGRGAMLVRSSQWLYRLGGYDESELASSSVNMALIGEEGQEEIWQTSASMPEGLSHSASFAAGNFIYVLGGRNDEGPVDTIYYTYLHPDGTLGFGADNHWESNIRHLPEGRSSAACLLHDGWIFLIGGATASGTTSSGATDSIIRARIYQDGQIGQWYPSIETLPEALWGAGVAELNGRLYIAGGANLQGSKTDMVSFALGSYGALSDRRIEADLPLALQKPIFLADRDNLILAGGFTGESWSTKVYLYNEGIWTETLHESKAEGPWFGQAGGSFFYQRSADAQIPGVGRLETLYLAPERPTVLPGSGLVPAGSPLLVRKEPGATIRYRTDGGEPSAQDTPLPETLFRISLDNLPSMKISLAAFNPDGSVSPTTSLEYRLRSGSLFVVTEKTLPIHDSGYSILDFHTLQSASTSGAMPTPVSSLWYRIRISQAGEYRLSWADIDQSPSYSARIMLSVYEADLHTEVPDQNDLPALERRSGTNSPLQFFLGVGDYYMQLNDVDGQEGGVFGLSLSKMTSPGI